MSERAYTAKQIRKWIDSRGYLSSADHTEFGEFLPTANLGHAMNHLAMALDDLAALRAKLAERDHAIRLLYKLVLHYKDHLNVALPCDHAMENVVAYGEDITAVVRAAHARGGKEGT